MGLTIDNNSSIIGINMTISYVKLTQARSMYLSSGEASRILGITPLAASRLVRQGKIPGVKIGRFYVIPRDAVESFSKKYIPRRGRPRTKRKYTKRSPIWFQ